MIDEEMCMYNYIWKSYTRIIKIQRVAIVMTVSIDKESAVKE
jgi:hypothetical protein